MYFMHSKSGKFGPCLCALKVQLSSHTFFFITHYFVHLVQSNLCAFTNLMLCDKTAGPSPPKVYRAIYERPLMGPHILTQLERICKKNHHCSRGTFIVVASFSCQYKMSHAYYLLSHTVCRLWIYL